jgi:Zinc finger C-x8-C-x5-C-x3-H type (and similar)
MLPPCYSQFIAAISSLNMIYSSACAIVLVMAYLHSSLITCITATILLLLLLLLLLQWKKHSPCNYFLKGQCSRGSRCKFSHSTTATGGHSSSTTAAGTSTMGCCSSPPVITPMLTPTPTGTGSSSQGCLGSDFDYAFQPSLGHDFFMVSCCLQWQWQRFVCDLASVHAASAR